MVPEIRQRYNAQFRPEHYQAFLEELGGIFPGQLDFRVAETPLFVPKGFTRQMLDACDAITERVLQADYKAASMRAIPPALRVPNEDEHPHFIAFDFGICRDAAGNLTPQLIELQAFPTLFAWHSIMPEVYRRHFPIPENYAPYLNGHTKESYRELLRKIIVADAEPESVILLELFPERQKTRVDFHATEALLGIRTVCLTKLVREGRTLFYEHEGRRIRVTRVYNRLIFDELLQQPQDIQDKGQLFFAELDVTWVPHPNWFYRLSKFTLPFIDHPNVPPTRFLHEVTELPGDLSQFVVKPLFSFAGQGVIIDLTQEAIDAIPDPENWILQQKVEYAAVIHTPDEPAKAEVRLFYFWEPGAPRPVAVNNLARLSKGKMVGVRYNKDKEWVGGTLCFFEQ